MYNATTVTLRDTADKVKVVGTFHVPSTWNPGKSLTANGTAERACTFCRLVRAILAFSVHFGESKTLKKTVKQVADRVGDNQRSEPPRPNKPSSEDHANKDRTTRPQKSLIDVVTFNGWRSRTELRSTDFPGLPEQVALAQIPKPMPWVPRLIKSPMPKAPATFG